MPGPEPSSVCVTEEDDFGTNRSHRSGIGSESDSIERPPLAVCRYDDGRGHPFWFARAMFAELRDLHGDKAVWKLLESRRWPVVDVPVSGPVPLDVDTWDDYQRLLETTP